MASLQAGTRVTWITDDDYWGSVVSVDGSGLIVRWDGSDRDAGVHRNEVRARGADKSYPCAMCGGSGTSRLGGGIVCSRCSGSGRDPRAAGVARRRASEDPQGGAVL
jgi:hypothetical protein